MKYLLTVLLLFSSHFAEAGFNYSKKGNILDPGMYWAIHARNELNDYKKGKGNINKVIHLLRLSAGYGFKPAMLSISAIYQNGDYEQNQDLSQAYAWRILSMGNRTNQFTKQIKLFQNVMTQEQLATSEQLLFDLSKTFSQDATMGKYERWYNDATTATGSRLRGVQLSSNLQISTNTGRMMSAFEFYKQMNEINDYRLDELYEVIPGKIKIIEE